MANEQGLKDQTQTIQTEESRIIDFQAIREALQRLRQLAETLPQVDAVAIVREGERRQSKFEMAIVIFSKPVH